MTGSPEFGAAFFRVPKSISLSSMPWVFIERLLYALWDAEDVAESTQN